MMQISGTVTEIIIADENEILCKVIINESLHPYFSIKVLEANITSINNIINKKEVSILINDYLNKSFTGRFMRKLTLNRFELIID